MKTPLFRYCLPTYSSRSTSPSRTKFYGPQPDYFPPRPRLIFPKHKTFNHFSCNQLLSLSYYQASALKLVTLSNFPGRICSGVFTLSNLYRNLPYSDVLRVMFLNLASQFSYSFYLLKVLSLPAF